MSFHGREITLGRDYSNQCKKKREIIQWLCQTRKCPCLNIRTFMSETLFVEIGYKQTIMFIIFEKAGL